eukprot:CAMPEP_0176383726 /NCGR_PEP_ID=MMETSP0126-20121128/33739_1 /TAXON_ID=141414 ORGANISM="Strombidinopsis acuminatum, Strain SPMC142" /NCGR_SAMPLE_ID=MMETSP0126 /ASSEMBLY_ACC=CAM_ASM_000229 /LENGTH=106 /DNA_ID=CAMNT_0017748977 /DNA_START=1249 /DNA_END=1569 /DNA_ORIENTATION=-
MVISTSDGAFIIKIEEDLDISLQKEALRGKNVSAAHEFKKGMFLLAVSCAEEAGYYIWDSNTDEVNLIIEKEDAHYCFDVRPIPFLHNYYFFAHWGSGIELLDLHN